MRDRGLEVNHTSMYRWVQQYSQVIVQNFNKRKRPVSKSCKMDETYIKVRGKWRNLYRAARKQGKTVDFMLSSKRDVSAAASFLCRATRNDGVPDKINIDKSGSGPQESSSITRLSQRALKSEGANISITL
jgi:putative transposase